jgi:membrane protein YqaA with SNARE-associated domain
MEAGQGPRAMQVVAGVSFAESALLPLPVDAVTVPVMLADRRRLWRVVWVATLASVLGGLVGYAIGRLLYETLVVWLVDLYGWQASFATIQTEFHQQGALIVLIGALTPIPFKLIAIASGVERLDLWLFLGVALFGRAGRFLSFGLLIWWLGPSIRRLLDRHASRAGWLVLLLLVGGFAAVGLL